MKIKGRHLILAVVLFLFGYITAFSYQYTQKMNISHGKTLENEDQVARMQEKLKEEREKSEALRKKLANVKQNVVQVENKKQPDHEHLMKTIEEYRMITGDYGVKGPGITVTLDDKKVVPPNGNPNNYIVHDRHIRKVINELFVAGAEAVAINNQRITSTTSVNCVGSVVIVDGVKHAEPFEISAIGNQKTMQNALQMRGNILDQLAEDGIEVKLEKNDALEFDARLSQKGE